MRDPSPATGPRSIPPRLTLDDPRALRALAHPARLIAIDELYAKGRVQTATALARKAGVSASAMSYHLRVLERHGVVVRTTGGHDGRERHWRAAPLRLSIAGGGDTGRHDGRFGLVELYLDRLDAGWSSWASRRHDPVLDALAAISSSRFRLSEARAAELVRELNSVLADFAEYAHTTGSPRGGVELEALISVLPVDDQRST